MSFEGRMFVGVGLFLAPITIIYWYLSKEPAGTTALSLAIGLCLLIGYYLLYTARRIDARPEDDPHGEIADGAGEMGFYSPHSWWPLAVAGSAAMTALGVVFGWWLVYLAVPVLMIAIVGWVFEYYRGEHQH